MVKSHKFKRWSSAVWQLMLIFVSGCVEIVSFKITVSSDVAL